MLELLESAGAVVEPEHEESVIPERHRILIAAAAVAVLGEKIRIVGIRPSTQSKRSRWTRQNLVPLDIVRKMVRRECKLRLDPGPENQEP
jgi:hypothetical protein